MTDHIEELRKRGMITSLAKVPGDKTDSIICAATLADAAADPALTLDIARELLCEAAAAIRCLHQYLARALSQPETEESRAITALKVTLFGRACYLPADIAQEVEQACAAPQAEVEAQESECPPTGDEVVFIDGVGAGRSSIKSCHNGVQWIRVGDRVYWPLSDSDAKRLQSACCGNGSFDGPASPASEGEQQ